VRPVYSIVIGLVLLTGIACAVELPDPQDTVNDYFNVINNDTKQTVRSLSTQISSLKAVNFKVALVMTTAPEDPYVFGRALYAKWNLGQTRLQGDRGVLLFVSVFERQAKIIVGQDIDYVLPQSGRDHIEWTVLQGMSNGDFSKGVLLGSLAISDIFLKEWPRAGKTEQSVDLADAFRKFLALLAAAILLTYVVGGSMTMMLTIMIGGLFGFISVNILGMAIGAGLGFLISIGRHSK
jgi:uncharacterized membrane protein YgcG